MTMPFKDVTFLGSDEVSIESEGIIYSEANNMSGCQCMNQDNQDKIKARCSQIADLIREIEELNK